MENIIYVIGLRECDKFPARFIDATTKKRLETGDLIECSAEEYEIMKTAIETGGKNLVGNSPAVKYVRGIYGTI